MKELKFICVCLFVISSNEVRKVHNYKVHGRRLPTSMYFIIVDLSYTRTSLDEITNKQTQINFSSFTRTALRFGN